MAFEIVPVDPDDAFTPVASAAPPEVGPKNVYKGRGQPQESATETITVPSAERFVLPKVVYEDEAPAEAKPEFKPEPVTEDDQLVPLSEIYDPKSDWAITRGIKTSFRGMGESLLTTADMARMATMEEKELADYMLGKAAEITDPRNARLQEPTYRGVESVGEAVTYGLESIGSMLGSLGGAAVYGGAPGAVVGGAAGSVIPGAGTVAGGVTGATVGTLGAFVASGPGGLLPELLAEKEVQQGLRDGTLDPHKLLGIATGSGLLVGAIDAVPAGKWLMKIGGKEVTKDAVKVLLKKAALRGAGKGSLMEAGTEGLQGTIEQATAALTSGNYDVAERAMNVLNNAIVGGIGGAGPGAVSEVVENARIEPPAAEEDEADAQAAAEATQPGVQDPGEAAVSSTPGDTGATKPAQPVTSEKPATVVATEGIDPTLKAATDAAAVGKPTAVAGAPVEEEVEEEDEGPAIPETEAELTEHERQQAELARLTLEQIERQRAEDAAREQEKAATTPKVTTTAVDEVAALAAQQPKPSRQPKPAAAAAAPVQAAETAAASVPPVGTVNIGENLGTGVNLGATPEIVTPTAEMPVVAAPAQQPVPLEKPEAAVTAAPATPALTEVLPTREPAAPEVAAFTPAPEPTVSVEAAPPLPVIDRQAIVDELAGDRQAAAATVLDRVGEALDRGLEVTLNAGGKPRTIVAVDKRNMVDSAGHMWLATNFVRPASKDEISVAEKTITPPVAAEVPGAVAVEPDDSFTPVAEPAAPRAEIIRAVSKAKEEPKPAAAPAAPAHKVLTLAEKIKQQGRRKKPVVIVAPKPTTGVAEREEAAPAVEGQPAAPTQPAAAPAAEEAKKTGAARSAAEAAVAAVRRHPDLTKTRVGELSEGLVDNTVAEVANEVAKAEAADMKGRSVREIVDAVVAKRAEMLAEVKKRLQPALDEYMAELERETDKSVAAKEAKEKAQAEEKTKVEKMAAETKGTKKERAGKVAGISPTGLRARSPDTWKKQAKAQAGKAGADQRVARIRELVLEEERKSTTEARKAEAHAEWRAIVEQLASERQAEIDAEAKEGGPKHTEHSVKTGKQIEKATAQVPLPLQPTGTPVEQQAQLNRHFAAFRAATAGIEVGGKHSTVYNTPLENLVIYLRKLDSKDYKALDGPLEFWMARRMLESGAFDEFNNLVTTEAIAGSELREETTAGKEASVVEQVEAGEVTSRGVHRQEAETAETVNILERRLGGRDAARIRALSETEREQRSEKGRGTIQVHDASGNVITVEGETMGAAAALRQVLESPTGIPSDWTIAGFFQLFRNMHIRRLMQMVGNVPVHIISDADMDRAASRKTGGFYTDYTDSARARGARPAVFIREGVLLDDALYSNLLIHELTHAATVMAYRANINGAAQIIRRMRVALLKELRAQGYSNEELAEAGVDYGMIQKNAYIADGEFIAEAFSNPAFQQMLANFALPPSIARDLRAVTGGRMLSWWQAFTRVVSQALGMGKGERGQSYMEGVVAVYPQLMRSSQWQAQTARENVRQVDFGKLSQSLADAQAAIGGQQMPKRLERLIPKNPLDLKTFGAQFNSRVENFKDSALSGSVTSRAKKIVKALSTTGQLQRRAAELLGGYDNPFHKVGDILLRRDPLRQKYRAIGQEVELALRKLKHGNRGMYKKLSHLVHEATRFSVDPMVPLSHANNKHVSKTGQRGARARLKHAELAAEWNALPAEVRKLAEDAARHYREHYERETTAHVTHAVRQALRERHAQLPAGKSEQDVVDWVLSKAAAREGDERTAEDKALHEALGETGKVLAAIPELRRLKGLYFPLARRGQWFITAIEKLVTPAGAIADPSSPDGNRFYFTSEARLDDYINSTKHLTRTTTRWVDPKTGERVITKEGVYINAQGNVVIPVKQWIVTVQNRHLEMSDSKRALRRRQQEMKDAGLEQVSAIAETQADIDKGVGSTLAPAHVKTILRNLHQTTVGRTTIGQKAAEAAVLDASVRAMANQSVLTRRIKRKGQMGYDEDIAEAMREYNQSTAHHLANLELAHELADAEAALQKFMGDRRRTAGDDTFEELQAMQAELGERFKTQSAYSERGGVNRVINGMLNTAYLRHLFSPHYTIIQVLQPFMTTLPVLSSQYGDGAAWGEILRAYRIGGVRRMLGAGAREGLHALKNINPTSESAISDLELRARKNGRGVHDQLWYDAVDNEPDASELHAVFDGIVGNGFGASSGIEAAAIAESGQNLVERTLSKTTNVAKALPEAAEGINRYVTAIAAYRLALRAGLSVADARTKAILTVEQTQGGYAGANNPRIFQHPVFRLPAQFRKYGVMYGQLYYGTLATVLSTKTDAETRRIAAKQLARLSATTFMFAGVGGLPMIELARILANVAVAIGLSDDDWEDHENNMQQWFADFLKFATGSEEIGDRLSEASMHGLTRLGGVDTSNMLGADNLITFGQPRNMDEEGFKAWLFDAVALGAGGGMAVDSIQALHNGDLTGVIPWPKIIQNLLKAQQLYTQGTVSKTTGEEYAPPVGIGEAIVQGLGFQPASVARQWEVKGGGRAQKEENQEFARRRALFDKWNRAMNRGDAKEASRVFREDIKAWNKAHKDPKFDIDMGNLMRSRAERERERRERERALR